MKILYITTVGGTMGFFTSFIRSLLDEGNTVDIATNENNGETKVPDCYREWGCRVFPLSCTRSPLDVLKNIKTIKEIRQLVEKEKYDIVHCHTPIAAFCTRIACRKLRGKQGVKVIYTAHGFHFYDGAPIKNWLLFYPVEWVCSWWTDVLITINKEDYERAKKHFHAKKVVYVPGVGIDTKKFAPMPNNREKIRKMLGLKDNQIMLLSVSELNENKNHEAVIRAIADNPDILYVIVGKGELEEHLSFVIRELAANVILTGHRENVTDFYDAADVYIQPSIREGINIALMEAMASELPVACSRNNAALIEDESCLFEPKNMTEVKRAIDYTIKNKAELGQQNLEKIRNFDLSSVKELTTVYSESTLIAKKKIDTVIAWQNKRREIGVPFDAKLLISVGELSKRKNHRIVVETLQQLPEDYWYVIVGQGELKEELKRLDKTGRLKLLGYRTDIVELLRCSDLFVFPSLQEGLPVALMEAMSCGVPCVASRIRGNVDLVKDNLFSPKNLEELIGAIEEKHAITSLSTCFSISNIEQTGNNLYKNVSNACFEQ